MTHEEIIDAVDARFPGLRCDPVAVADQLARRFPEGAPLPAEGVAEIALALACAAGDPPGLALFEAHYLDVVPLALARMKLGADRVDEIRQLVRQKLLVAEPEQVPKVVSYAGEGRLRGLVQVVAVRTAVSALRKEGRMVGDHELARHPDPEQDPELAYLKAHYRAAFAQAFEASLRALSARDRNLLRLQLEGGLTVEELGRVYGVHRATATRWLTRLRAELLKETRRRLGAVLEAPEAELDSVIRLVKSRLDLSLHRMLQTMADPVSE